MKKIKKLNSAVFFITLFITYSLIMGHLFAATSEFKEIQKMETTQQAGQLAVSLRPRVEYKAQALRDPFRGFKTEGTPGIKDAGVKPPTLTIQGIVWGGSVPQAIINNKVVKIGDLIEDARIIDINKEGVIIFFGGRQYNLNSPAAASLISAEEKQKGGKDGKKD